MFYEFPGFDPKTFNDEELLKKSNELEKKMAWASRFSSGMMYDGMMKLKIMIDNERRERLSMDAWKQIEPWMSAVIDTEVDSSKIEEVPAFKKKQNPLKKAIQPTLAPTPTARPVKAKDTDDE